MVLPETKYCPSDEMSKQILWLVVTVLSAEYRVWPTFLKSQHTISLSPFLLPEYNFNPSGENCNWVIPDLCPLKMYISWLPPYIPRQNLWLNTQYYSNNNFKEELTNIFTICTHSKNTPVYWIHSYGRYDWSMQICFSRYFNKFTSRTVSTKDI